MAFGSLEEAFAWIESFTNLERSASLFNPRTYQLERMRFLAAACGNPQTAFPTVHLAGTKGKGSTATLLAESLRRDGRRTGLYTSPHVDSYRERIRILAPPRPGQPEHWLRPQPQGELLLAQAEQLRRLVETLPQQALEQHGPPSTFELLTLLAFCTFRAASCDIAVIETGIGGRLDATNLVLPELAVITPIELEHTDVLGDTLEAIAREKAGIIKPGVPVISAPQVPEAEAVLRAAARERGCSIVFLGIGPREAGRSRQAGERPESGMGPSSAEPQVLEVVSTPEGTRVHLRLEDGGVRELRTALLGAHQGENAALAFVGLRRLGVPEGAIAAGLAAASLPARMELLQRSPPVVLDGAHTPRSVARLLSSFRELFGEAGVLLFAAAAGKRIDEMAAILAPAFRGIVITGTGSFRESRPEQVHRAFAARNPAAELVADPPAGLERALRLCGPESPLLITGSFYLAGEVRRAWRARLGERPWPRGG